MGNLAPLNGECPRSGARAPRLTCPNIGVELPSVSSSPIPCVSSGCTVAEGVDTIPFKDSQNASVQVTASRNVWIRAPARPWSFETH